MRSVSLTRSLNLDYHHRLPTFNPLTGNKPSFSFSFSTTFRITQGTHTCNSQLATPSAQVGTPRHEHICCAGVPCHHRISENRAPTRRVGFGINDCQIWQPLRMTGSRMRLAFCLMEM